MFINNKKINLFGLFIFTIIKLINCNEDAKRLYDDLMVNYNRNTRPVKNPFEPLIVHIKLRLSQIIDVVSYLIILINKIKKKVFFF